MGVSDDSFYLCFNGDHQERSLVFPDSDWFTRWVKLIDTSQPLAGGDGHAYAAGAEVPVERRSVLVFRHAA